MQVKRAICLLAALCCAAGICTGVSATEVDCDEVYCFGTGDFSEADEVLTGICITGLPDEKTGTVMLGCRVTKKRSTPYL